MIFSAIWNLCEGSLRALVGSSVMGSNYWNILLQVCSHWQAVQVDSCEPQFSVLLWWFWGSWIKFNCVYRLNIFMRYTHISFHKPHNNKINRKSILSTTLHRQTIYFQNQKLTYVAKLTTKALLTNLNSVNWMYLNAEWIITAEIGGNEALW